jgi:hypothetical protein
LDVNGLRAALAGCPLPRAADGRLVLAVDVTCWLRPEAHTAPDRILCHTYGRGKDTHIMVPGWPYSFVVALEAGRSSWTAILDAVRLTAGADLAAVTAAQLRAVIDRLIAAGHWRPGDPDILVVADAGYDGPRLAWLLRDLPAQVLTRMRSDRVLRRPTPQRPPGTWGRPRRHGGEFVFGDPGTWGDPDVTTRAGTRLYGPAHAQAWDRLHPRLTRRAAWADCQDLPVIEGTVIRLQVDHLPSNALPKPVWLWSSATGLDPDDVDRLWQAFLRRFDIEHTFRLLKQVLGWTSPKIRTPQAADRWTWLILAAHTQLRLARPHAADHRRPWEKPVDARQHPRLTPARVRRDFRHLRAKTPTLAGAPKPCRPGPGRPPGRRGTPAPRHDVRTSTGLTSPGTRKPTPGTKKSTNPRPRRTG